MRAGSPFLLAGTLLAGLLAGCAGGPEGSSSGLDPGRDAFSDTTGAVQGFVTDTELRPLEGALVGDAQANVTAQTDADGGFLLRNLPAGPMDLLVQALGHHPKRVTVDVLANDVARVEVALEVAPGLDPYIELLIQRGYVTCEANAVFFVYSPGAIPGCDQWNGVFNVHVADTWRHLMVEASWRNQEALHLVSDTNTVCFLGTESDDPCFMWATAPSPVRFDGLPNTTWSQAPPDFVYPEGEFDWVIWAASAGLLQREVNESIVCQAGRPNGPPCPGVGVSPGYAFDLYLSLFHHEANHDLTTYTALPDE